MMTSTWGRYAGPGRIALSAAPRGAPRGYKLAPRGLFLRKPLPAPEVRARLLDLDALATWRELHALVYPAVPVLMGDALEPVGTYRRVVADWLAEASRRSVRELNAATYRAGRSHPASWRMPAPPPVFPIPKDIRTLAHHGQQQNDGKSHV